MPILPVAQKSQAAAQPTWLETHSVVRPVAIRRTTDSSKSPAGVRNSSLVAPSCCESQRL